MALGAQLREARKRMKQTASEVAAATRMKVQIVEAIEEEDFSKIAAPIYGKGFIRLYAEHVGLDPLPLVDEYMVRFVESKMPSLITDEPPRGAPAPETGEPVATAPAEEEEEAAAEAAPEPGPEEDDLDLFARLDRPARGEPANRKRRPTPNVRERSLGDIGHALAAFCSRLWTRTTGVLRERMPWRRPREKKNQPPRAGKPGRLPLRVVSIGAGTLIILVFILSVLSRCMPGPSPDAGADTPEKLRVAIEPSAPYFD